MNTITRNPDVSLHKGEKIPVGYYLHKGNASRYAKLAKIPFGYVYDRVTNPAARGRIVTIGLVIRHSDRARMDAALALRGTLKKQKP